MKGHMQDGKFHPHSEYKKGTRKSRDQKEKAEGVRLRRTDAQRMEIKKAERLGEQAFEKGLSNIPAGDPNVTELLKGRKVSNDLTIPQLKAWIDGWHNAERELERYEKDTALDFIKRHPDATVDNLSESTDIRDPDRIVAILELYGKVTENFDPKDKLKEFPQYRIKGAEKETPPFPQPPDEDDPHTYGQTALDTLSASKVNGFPFFAYTGINDFVLFGETDLLFNNIPKNPNDIERVVVAYDIGQDLYNVNLFKMNNPLPERLEGIFFDELANVIVDGMGVR